MAYLALFFTLCGTSYGAAASLLPKNSVGSAQVVNGSLKKADLSAPGRRVPSAASTTPGR